MHDDGLGQEAWSVSVSVDGLIAAETSLRLSAVAGADFNTHAHTMRNFVLPSTIFFKIFTANSILRLCVYLANMSVILTPGKCQVF